MYFCLVRCLSFACFVFGCIIIISVLKTQKARCLLALNNEHTGSFQEHAVRCNYKIAGENVDLRP